MSWRIERLDSEHERDSFDCGKELLTNFFKHFATQYRKKNLGQTYVAVTEARQVAGYYTISTSRVDFLTVPEGLRKHHPQIPIPVILLGRLAVDPSFQRQGVGRALLTVAFRQAAELGEVVGIAAVEVDALDDEARDFYRKYGFTSLHDDARHLYMPIKVIRKLIEEA